MKLTKIEKEPGKVIRYVELVDKINEIIDVLNKSFITDEPDTFAITCDTLTPLSNEHTPTFITSLSTDDCCIDNMVHGKSIKGNEKCPHCGESYYAELHSTITAVYYPPIYKDGVNINPDKNKATTHCECLNCGKFFDI